MLKKYFTKFVDLLASESMYQALKDSSESSIYNLDEMSIVKVNWFTNRDTLASVRKCPLLINAKAPTRSRQHKYNQI